MENEYDDFTSFHYLQYRPPLHDLILQKCLDASDTFSLGLDIGCGVGNSSIALSKYCEQVIGVDPSTSMLKNTIIHPKVEYQVLLSESFTFKDQCFDIITFAGSLFYAKSQRLLDEILRISKNKTKIVVYDFEIKLNPILQSLTEVTLSELNSPYNHQEDFSGLNASGMLKKIQGKEDLEIDISIQNIVHLLLSSKDYYQILVEKFGASELEVKVKSAIKNSNEALIKNIRSTIFYSIYEVCK